MSRKQPSRPRVFCLGWHKTGTTTMGMALLRLGYSVLGARLDLAEPLLVGDLKSVLVEAGRFDALQDVPWAALYRELDETYPGSKFILTVRDEDAWLHSAAKHFKDHYFQLHEWLYGEGVLAGNEELYRERYRRHYAEVRAYFADRPDDLLVMDFAAGDGWEELCGFLGARVPARPFPHANKGRHSYDWKDKLWLAFQGMVPLALRRKRVEILEKLGLHRGRNRFNNRRQHTALRERRKREEP